MASALTQSELFALLSAGENVVVPHAHAAAILRSRFQQLLPANTVVEHGSLLAWSQWLGSLWSDLILDGKEERVLLNRAQEDLLWTGVIASRPGSPSAGSQSLAAQAQLARSGLRLAAAYNAVDRLRNAADGIDTRTFAGWVDSFRDACTRGKLLPAALLEQALTRHLRAGSLRQGGVLHLVGFETFTPAQRDIVSALRLAGTTVHLHALQHEQSGRTPNLIIRADSARDQLRFAVRWVAQQAAATPGTFALVTPHPEDHRPELERHLREIVAPELLPVTADLSSTAWEFSTKPLLNSTAIVAHALDLIRWAQDSAPLERIGEVLLSPYFQFADSLESRARFETRLRRNVRPLRPELDLGQFTDLLSQSVRRSNSAGFPELQSLRKLIAQKNLLQGTRTHADWADQARSILAALGWPGPRTLTASEFAAFEAWERTLDLLATLDFTGRRLSFSAFLQRLEEEVGRTGFSADAPAAPIQICTLPEAEAIPFDFVLVLDATDADLPAAEKPHPLLPRALQRSLEMPGTDPGRTSKLVRNSLAAMMARSRSLHLVAPAHDVSGDLRPTRLAADLGFTPSNASDVIAPEPVIAPLELIEADETTPLPPLPSAVVQGGARVLELQSACGFRAFADLRLRAEEPPASALGLNPREAGSRLHLALQTLWQELKDQATLRALPTPERRAMVREAVQHALQPLAHAPGSERSWPRAFLQILEDRFTTLLMQWLAAELTRSPFHALSQEQEQAITVGPLELSIRPDRVDQVDGGGLVFIDYKTKYSLSTKDWQGPRPDAPQLPLYTLLAKPEDVRGLAFARVRAGKDMGWVSLSNQPGLFPKNANNTQADLQAEMEAWREELTRLAEEFANGNAFVDPKTYPQTCQYCAHRLLCRLDPAELMAQVTDEDEDELEEEIHA